MLRRMFHISWNKYSLLDFEQRYMSKIITMTNQLIGQSLPVCYKCVLARDYLSTRIKTSQLKVACLDCFVWVNHSRFCHFQWMYSFYPLGSYLSKPIQFLIFRYILEHDVSKLDHFCVFNWGDENELPDVLIGVML